jgi:hypothetical protein
MKQRRSTHGSVAALMAASAFALAGCAQALPGGSAVTGGSAPPGGTGAAAVVRAAYTRTVATHSAHVHVVEAVTGVPQLGPYAVQADGRLDLAHDAAEFTLTAPVLGTSQVRVVASTLYTRLPAAVAALLGTKPWIRVDLTRQPTLGAGFGGGLTDELSLLDQVSSSVTKVGTPSVGGVATTEYLAHVEGSKVLAKAGLAAALAARAPAVGAAVPVHVWIDAQGRTRQLAVSLSIPAVGTMAAVHLELTETLSDFGTPVTVTAPPASQVGSLSGLGGLIGSGLTGTGA